MKHTLFLLLATVAGCASSPKRLSVPLGWTGIVAKDRQCDETSVAPRGRITGSHPFFTAAQVGPATIWCGDAPVEMEIRPVGRVTIDVPAKLEQGASVDVHVTVLDERGKPFDVSPDAEWSVTGPFEIGSHCTPHTTDMPIIPPACTPTRLTANGRGAGTIHVTVAGKHAELAVQAM